MTTNGDRRGIDDGDRRSVEERRVQLIEAATEVIATEGLGRATTRRITDHADLALGAFHYAFRSKDELLESVIEHIARHLESVLRGAVSDPKAGLESAIEQLVSGYWAFAETSPDLQLAQAELTVHALRDPKLRSLAGRQYDGYVEVVDQVLAQVPDAPPEQERQDLARFLLATMDGLVLQRLLQGDHEASERRVAMYLRCLGTLSSSASRRSHASS